MGSKANKYLRDLDNGFGHEYCTICGKETWFKDHQKAVDHVRQEHLKFTKKQKQRNITEVTA